jgi:hypothetical protein
VAMDEGEEEWQCWEDRRMGEGRVMPREPHSMQA